MRRRHFIRLTSSASVLSMLPTEVFSMFKSVGAVDCQQDLNAKKLVLIQLSGANDGLNTIVPINQYDKYASLRPTIKLNNTGSNSIINLDTTLSIENQVGLHPSLSGFKSLYDAGLMRVVQGVGYPFQNQSHFKSTDLWLSGGDGTTKNNNFETGWVGRFIENQYKTLLEGSYPLGLQLAGSDNSALFHGEEHSHDLNITGQDPAGFYSVINGLSGEPPSFIPNSEYGDLIRYILENDRKTNVYSQSISAAFSKGKNSVTYPNTDLSNQLKTVAKLISGGLETKVYLVRINGWDTHDTQVANKASTHTGKHAELLKTLSDAVNNFMTDINMQSLGRDVVAVTFSEFGRKAAENASLGTDHGQIAPMFVFGKPVAPGISGTNVDLNEPVAGNNFQLIKFQHDYRRVFGTILQDWLGSNNSTLDLTFYDYTNNKGFTASKLKDVIKSSDLACNTVNLTTAANEPPFAGVSLYPNPASDVLNISTANEVIHQVAIGSLDGQQLLEFKSGAYSSELTIDVSRLIGGLYFVRIDTDQNQYLKRIIVRR
jgi:uncharacterized protein (DUF1501 family)